MIDIDHVAYLQHTETELQVAIWKHEKSNAPVVIINDMKEALEHISKAIAKLSWAGWKNE